MSTPSAAPGTPTPAAAATPTPAPSTGRAPAPGRWGSLGPVGLVLAGGLSVQFGAALAVSLMPAPGRSAS